MHKVSDHINKNLLPRGFQNVLFVTPLGGGGNNRVFKILLENSEVYVLKKYEPHLEKENHEGLAREFSALEALWKLGFDNIPVPVFQEKESGAGIYSFISGRPIKRADDSFLKQAAEFMRDLWGVKELIPETSIAPATDHCFCLKDYRDNVEKRLNTLLSIEASGSPLNEVKQFLKTDIRPFFNNLVSDVYFRKMLSGDPALSHGQLIPSPSDFGFHNALKDAGGRVFFLDFEYFGWDDPAKLICDSLHHPAMGLDFSMRKRFLTRYNFPC